MASAVPQATRVLQLARRGDREGLGAVLRRNPDLLNKPSDGHNRTLLWEAAHAGRVDMVRWLVSEGADVDIPGRYRSETFVLVKPYTVAVLRKRTEIAEFLLDSGTVVDVYTAAFLGDDDRVMAAVGDDPVIVNADQPEETVWRVTPLHHALAGGHASVVCTLLRHGVAVADHAALAFDIACRPARTDLVDLLLDAGSEPMAADVFSVVYAGDDGLAATFFGRGLDPDKPTAGWPPIVCVTASLVMWTWYAVSNARFLRSTNTISETDWSSVVGIASLGWAFGLARNPLSLDLAELFDVAVWSVILGGGSTWFGTVLFNRASKLLETSILGQLIVFEAVFGVLYVFVFSGSAPSAWSLAGICIALMGVWWSVRSVERS